MFKSNAEVTADARFHAGGLNALISLLAGILILGVPQMLSGTVAICVIVIGRGVW